MSELIKWTPGPWQVSRYGCVTGSRTVELTNGVAPLQVALATANDSIEERDANAQLIAAAPELYEACEIVKAYLRRLEEDTEPFDPLKAVRERYHAPLHAALESAMTKARGNA